MTLNWIQIFRMGLVQMCLGAVVVLTTSTLNRLMVVELALPALLPGLLVGLHYGIQITRPNWGFLSDTSGNRTRWIIGGMVVLAAGGWLAALGVVMDGGTVRSRPCAVGAGLCAHRRGRGGLGHLASGAAGERLRAAPPGGGGDDHLADDDRGDRDHGDHGRRISSTPTARRCCSGSSARWRWAQSW